MANYTPIDVSDMMKLQTRGAILFYEYLSQCKNDRQSSTFVDIKAEELKQMIACQDENSANEKIDENAVDALCKEMAACNAIRLNKQKDGKPYEKIIVDGKVTGYRFFFTCKG